MVRRYPYIGWDKQNPTDPRPPYPRAIALMPSPHANYAAALGLPVNNTVIRARFYSPAEVQRADPAKVTAPKMMYYTVKGRSGRMMGASKTMFGANPNMDSRMKTTGLTLLAGLGALAGLA